MTEIKGDGSFNHYGRMQVQGATSLTLPISSGDSILNLHYDNPIKVKSSLSSSSMIEKSAVKYFLSASVLEDQVFTVDSKGFLTAKGFALSNGTILADNGTLLLFYFCLFI